MARGRALIERTEAKWKEIKKKYEKKIWRKESDETNPWLDRTGWMEHFEDCERDEILTSMREPEKEEEVPLRKVWETAKKLIHICQNSVKSEAGVIVRIKAIRTEK